jgi:superfamily I DNA/RNA helicase
MRAVWRLAHRLAGEPGGSALAELLAHLALLDDGDAPDGVRVTLATVHAAKGLEWRAVRVVGLEDGVFPNDRAIQEGALEDERLAYVAFTRASERLALSWAARRCGRTQLPSRFIAESGLSAQPSVWAA